MKRNLKKAMAFAMATATLVANLGVTMPVAAAEFSGAEKILDTEYDIYGHMGDNMYFGSYVEVENEDELSTTYLDEITIVDPNGETSSLEVKDADGEYKYKDIYRTTDDCMGLIQADGSYVFFREDGSCFVDQEKLYDDIMPLDDGNYIVSNETECKVVDMKGAVVAEDIFEPVSCEDIFWEINRQFNDSILIVRNVGVGIGEYVEEAKIFDSSYNEVEDMELDNASVRIIDDYLVIYTDKDVNLYDKNLKKLDFTYKRDDLKDPLEAGEYIPVLCDYTIKEVHGVSRDYPYGEGKSFIYIYVELYYSDSTGENYYYDYEENMYDYDTFERCSYEEIYNSLDENGMYRIDNTDLSYKYNEEIDDIEFYYNSKSLYSRYGIYEYVVSEKALKNTTFEGFLDYGVGDDIFFEVSIEFEDASIKKYSVLLTKETGYSLDSGVVYDKCMNSLTYGILDYIVFDDDTCYFNGKFYDSADVVDVFGIDDKSGFYSLREGEEGAYTWKLYDIEDRFIAEITDKMHNITESGIVVSAKIVESNDEFPKYYFGCYYLGKILTSSDEILEELEKAEEGDSIEAKLDKNELVKAEVLEKIKGKDIEIVLTTESGAKWTINGKDVKGTELKDIDLTVDIVENVIPTEAINKVEIKGDKIELTIAHTGEFGFDTKLTLNVKAENNGKYANLFYYNSTSKKLEFQESAKVDANGDVVFDFAHASDYVIFISDAQYVEDTTDNAGDSGNTTVLPDTGDASNAGFLMAVIVIAAGTFVLTKTKKATAK